MSHKITVVDYDAWQRGYMPPSEHVLIDQLAYRGARVVTSADHTDDGAFWVVVRGFRPSEKSRKVLFDLHDVLTDDMIEKRRERKKSEDDYNRSWNWMGS